MIHDRHHRHQPAISAQSRRCADGCSCRMTPQATSRADPVCATGCIRACMHVLLECHGSFRCFSEKSMATRPSMFMAEGGHASLHCRLLASGITMSQQIGPGCRRCQCPCGYGYVIIHTYNVPVQRRRGASRQPNAYRLSRGGEPPGHRLETPIAQELQASERARSESWKKPRCGTRAHAPSRTARTTIA